MKERAILLVEDNPDDEALTLHAFGAGDAALVAFDPAVPATDPARTTLEEVFAAAVNHVAPDQAREARAGTVVPLAFTLTNPTSSERRVEVSVTLPRLAARMVIELAPVPVTGGTGFIDLQVYDPARLGAQAGDRLDHPVGSRVDHRNVVGREVRRVGESSVGRDGGEGRQRPHRHDGDRRMGHGVDHRNLVAGEICRVREGAVRRERDPGSGIRPDGGEGLLGRLVKPAILSMFR